MTGRPTHFIKGYGPSCPECGCIRSKRIANGWSDPDDHYLRYKRCDECAAKFVTVEVIVPTDETTFYRLDHVGRTWRREHYRRRYAKTTERNPGNMRDGDELRVKVRVKPAIRNTCGRGHLLTAANTLSRDSGRRCRQCRADQDRIYYLRRQARKREEAA
jgi:hypothetical protein